MGAPDVTVQPVNIEGKNNRFVEFYFGPLVTCFLLKILFFSDVGFLTSLFFSSMGGGAWVFSFGLRGGTSGGPFHRFLA